MGTPGGYHEHIIEYPKSRSITAVLTFIITDGRILHQICFKSGSIFIHCLSCDASSLLDT